MMDTNTSRRAVGAENNAVTLSCDAVAVRVKLYDGRILVGRSRQLTPQVYAFRCFGETRPRRLFLERVRVADVVSFPRHADWTAVARAQALGDFSGKVVRFRAHTTSGDS